MDVNSIIRLILVGMYFLLLVSSIIVVITGNRNPTKTLAWLLILVFLPVAGLVLYYIFGQDGRRQRKQKITYEEFSEQAFRSMGIEHDKWMYAKQREKVRDDYVMLVNLLLKSNDSVVWYGSDVEIITSGKRKFEALLEDLENSAHHIHMEYFYFKKDEMGRKIKEVLMKKAAEGVEVRFIYENIANISVPPRFYNEMKKAGVRIVPFFKGNLSWVRRNLNYRDHRKIVVIDGKIGYTGGMNIGNEYYDGWRDTHLRIRGQAVFGLQSSFLYEWYSSGGDPVSDFKPYFPPCLNYSQNLMQIAPESPASEWPYLLMATVDIVVEAKEYVYIQTPYYMPSDSLFQALQAAALAGVDVRIMVSRKSDFVFMDYATQSFYEDSLKAGIRIYEAQDTFIHAKMMVSDDYISVIGSANMDSRSLELSFEINCFSYDEELALRCKDIFFDDLRNCREVMSEEWRERPWWRKLFESVMRLLSPLL